MESDYGRPNAPRVARPDATELAILKRNTRMMLALGLNGTPGFVYRVGGRGPVRFLDGLPPAKDLASLFLPSAG
jgi:protein-disulfide isomerase